MEALKDKLKEEFEGQYTMKGFLPFLSFKAQEEEHNRFLLVGSEHGDKPYGTKAMAGLAKKLKKNPLKYTTIDMLPVLDTEGYPRKRSIIGEFGLGSSTYMDSAYWMERKPHQIKTLLSMIDDTKYSLALLLSSNHKEEAPIINGFFMVPQLKVDGNKTGFLYPQSKDLRGAVVQALKGEELPVLNKDPKDAYLGAGHIIFSEGFVLQGVPGVDKKSVAEFKTTNGFLASCASRSIPALALYALSSSNEKEFKPTKALKTALETIVEVYEKRKR